MSTEQKTVSPFVYYSKKGNKLIKNPKNNHVWMIYKGAGNMKISFKNKMINDENRDLCGGWSTYKNIAFEETDRVIQGLKPIGISRSFNEKDVKDKIKEYEEKGFLVSSWIKEWSSNRTMYYVEVSPKGKII